MSAIVQHGSFKFVTSCVEHFNEGTDMVTMTGGFLTILIALAVLGCCLYFIGLTKQDPLFNLIGVTFMSMFFFLLGYHDGKGSPVVANEKGSLVRLAAGHYYETLVKVPGGEEREFGEKTKSRLFVIKDGESKKVLLIRIDEEVLPPHFTMDDREAIIALPAPAPMIESPVTPK